jgi:hypothetical protein
MKAVTSISTRADAGVRAASTCRTRRTERFSMRARDVVDIRHIDHIHDGPNDVTQLRTGVAKGCRDRSDGGHHLRIGIAIEVVTAGRRS